MPVIRQDAPRENADWRRRVSLLQHLLEGQEIFFFPEDLQLAVGAVDARDR